MSQAPDPVAACGREMKCFGGGEGGAWLFKTLKHEGMVQRAKLPPEMEFTESFGVRCLDQKLGKGADSGCLRVSCCHQLLLIVQA